MEREQKGRPQPPQVASLAAAQQEHLGPLLSARQTAPLAWERLKEAQPQLPSWVQPWESQ